MVRPGLRSRTQKRIYVKAPKGVRIHYRKRNQTKQTCKLCGDVLKGTVHGTSLQKRKFSKSEKKPSRMFGGELCSKCARNTLIQRARVIRNG